jgi:hypothetical protein
LPKPLISLRTLILTLLALFLAGCAAAPILAVQAAVQLASIAMRATDPNYGPRMIKQPTMAEQAHSKCAENDAGPETDCIDYMTHMTGSYY